MRKSILPLLLGGALIIPAVALAGGMGPAIFGTVGKMRLLERAPTSPVRAAQSAPMLAVPAVWMTPPPIFFAPPPGLILARMQAMTQAMQAQVQQMNRLMTSLDAAAFAPPPVRSAAPGDALLTVSMIAVSSPGGACSETIIARPGPQGTMQVQISHHGPGCGQLPGMTAMPPATPSSPSHGVTVHGRHFLPSDRLPPPSKTHFAKFLTTPLTPHPVKG